MSSSLYSWDPRKAPISVTKILQARKKAGLTQAELTDRLPDTHNRRWLRDVEAGTRTPPTGAEPEVAMLAKALGCGVFHLFEYPPAQTPKRGPVVNRLQELRRKAGLPAAAVSRYIGVGEAKISDLERGQSATCRNTPEAERLLSLWWGEPWEQLMGPPLEASPAHGNGSSRATVAGAASEAPPRAAEAPESASPASEVHVNGHGVLPLAEPERRPTVARDAAEVMLDEVLAIRTEIRTMCADLVELRQRMTAQSQLIQSVNRAVLEQGEALKRQFGGIHGRLTEVERKVAEAAEASAPIRYREEPIIKGPWTGGTALIPSKDTGYRGVIAKLAGGNIVAFVETNGGSSATPAQQHATRDLAIQALMKNPLLADQDTQKQG